MREVINELQKGRNSMITLKSALIAMLFLAPFQGGTTYKVETRYPVPGNGGFD